MQHVTRHTTTAFDWAAIAGEDAVLTQLVRDKKQLRAAHDTKAAAWPRVLAVLAEHGERLSEMITDRLPLADAIDGFERARNRDAMKILLKPETA